MKSGLDTERIQSPTNDRDSILGYSVSEVEWTLGRETSRDNTQAKRRASSRVKEASKR